MNYNENYISYVVIKIVFVYFIANRLPPGALTCFEFASTKFQLRINIYVESLLTNCKSYFILLSYIEVFGQIS